MRLSRIVLNGLKILPPKTGINDQLTKHRKILCINQWQNHTQAFREAVFGVQLVAEVRKMTQRILFKMDGLSVVVTP